MNKNQNANILEASFFKPCHSSDQVSKRLNVDAIAIFWIVMRLLIWYF